MAFLVIWALTMLLRTLAQWFMRAVYREYGDYPELMIPARRAGKIVERSSPRPLRFSRRPDGLCDGCSDAPSSGGCDR